MNSLLSMLKDAATIPTSVLMHILICLSYLSKERFSQALDETHFVDKISDFVELYSQLNPQAAVNSSQINQNGKSHSLVSKSIESDIQNPNQNAA